MLHNNGLTKLSEECGELVQAIAKFTTFAAEFPGYNIHWDGTDIYKHLEDEIADVLAASTLVTANLELNTDHIAERTLRKTELFRYWHQGGKETSIPAESANQKESTK